MENSNNISKCFYKAGIPLFTKNGEWYTNAFIVNETKEGFFEILTDFGNLITLNKEETKARYSIPQWYFDSLAFGYPLPTIKERIQQQIDLLLAAKEVISNQSL